MEAEAEFLIATYLTRGGKVFIAPQFSIPGEQDDTEWSCPDFVALDFGMREIVVVEASIASAPNPLINKVKDREAQWYTRLRDKLKKDGVVSEEWKIRTLCFLRRDNLSKVRSLFSSEKDVAFHAIEDAAFPHEYWEKRKLGLPR